jgi:hypothetical protein
MASLRPGTTHLSVRWGFVCFVFFVVASYGGFGGVDDLGRNRHGVNATPRKVTPTSIPNCYVQSH